MKKAITVWTGLPTFFIVLTLVLGITGCAGLSPGSPEDPGEAVGAPTAPEVIREGWEEGDQYPEENP